MGGKPSQPLEDDTKQPDLEKGAMLEEKKTTTDTVADPRDKKSGKLNEEKMASMTPSRLLLYGASEGNKDVVRSAREAGGDVNTPDTGPVLKQGEKPSNDAYANIITGNYPLHMAAENGFTEMITLLFHFEANLENKNKIGSTALHTAVSHGHVDAVRELLKLGAKISALNNMGNTAVHCCAYTGNTEIMEVLLQNGGTRFIQFKNKVEMTPIDYARKKAMADLLTNASVQAGHISAVSVPAAITEEDRTPLEMKSTPITPAERKEHAYDDVQTRTTPAELRASVDQLKQTLNIEDKNGATRTGRKRSTEEGGAPMLSERAFSESTLEVVFHTNSGAPGSPLASPMN